MLPEALQDLLCFGRNCCSEWGSISEMLSYCEKPEKKGFAFGNGEKLVKVKL